MRFAGVDYSMTSPAVCVFEGDDEFDFSGCRIYYYTDKAKYAVQKLGFQLRGHLARAPKESMARFDYISGWALPQLLSADYIMLEDYAYGAKGQVFNIGENTGVLKYRLWKHDKKYSTVAPTQVKKFATGKGNAKKEDMHDAFTEETGINLMAVYNSSSKNIINPVSDIVDAYYICKYGFHTYKERKSNGNNTEQSTGASNHRGGGASVEDRKRTNKTKSRNSKSRRGHKGNQKRH